MMRSTVSYSNQPPIRVSLPEKMVTEMNVGNGTIDVVLLVPSMMNGAATVCRTPRQTSYTALRLPDASE